MLPKFWDCKGKSKNDYSKYNSADLLIFLQPNGSRMLIRIFRNLGIALLLLLLLAVGVATTAYLMRNQLIQLFVNEANKSIKTEIFVDKISLDFIHTFPEFAIEFKGVKIVESVIDSKKAFATAKSLYFSFSIWDLLKQKYKIKNLYLKDAKLNFQILADGTNNFSIIERSIDTSQKANIIFDLKGVKLENVDVLFNDKPLKNSFGAVFHDAKANFKLLDEDWEIDLAGDLRMHEIKLSDWSFFNNQHAAIESKIIYSAKNKTYKVLPSNLNVQNANFAVEGLYKDGKNDYIEFKFSEQNSDFQTIVSFLPAKFSEHLVAYKSNGKVYFNGIVKGEISRTQKIHIKIDFGCSDASFFHPQYDEGIENVSFNGTFDNEAEKEKTGVFKIENIKATMNEKPFQAQFYLRSFYNPYVELKAKSTVDAGYFFKVFPNEQIENIAGEIGFDIDFKGKLADVKAKNYSELHTVGDIKLRDIAVKLKDYHLRFERLDADFIFTKTDLHANSFSTQLGKSDIKGSGTLSNVIPYFLYENEPVNIDAAIASKHLNLQELLSTTKKARDEKYKFKLSDKLAFHLSTKVEQLIFQKFKPFNVEATLVLQNQKLEARNVTMNIAKGNLTLNGSMMQQKDTSFATEAKFKLDKMLIDSICFMTDNFGQDFITYKNLKGEITSEVSAILVFDKHLNIMPKSIVAEVNTIIRNGQLVAFAPMKSLAKFVDEDALANIRFSELKNTIQIAKQTVFIPEMEIASNINKMSVMGSHSFENVFEYRLKIPLKNYKKKNNLEEQQAIEGNIFAGFYLYLIIKGTPSNFKILYDKSAVKQKIKERWQEEKQEIKEIFKKDYQKKQIEKQKPAEVNEDEYFNF